MLGWWVCLGFACCAWRLVCGFIAKLLFSWLGADCVGFVCMWWVCCLGVDCVLVLY